MGNGNSDASAVPAFQQTDVPASQQTTDAAAFPSPQPPVPSPARAPARAYRIALVAGEASGDQLGAGLVAELKRRHPQAQFAGVGGPRMRAAGLDAWHDCSALAVMGIGEVVRHLPRLLRLRASLRQRLLDWKPDVFIGIDAPDFNLGLERTLKDAGIRTVHYVSPSIWAWRENRAATIGRSADRVLCLFPMEPSIYANHHVAARFVGHPLADAFALAPDQAAARAALALPASATIVSVLPGSRLGEIKRLGPDFLHACALLLAQRPKLVFVAPMANAACRELFTAQIARVAGERGAAGLREAMHLLDGRAHEALVASDVALLASGTAALEAMLAKRPMVVGYRVARSTQAIVRGLNLLKIPRYSLPNVLHEAVPDGHGRPLAPKGEALVPERIQGGCTPRALAADVLAWLDEPARAQSVVARFGELHLALRRDASSLAADTVDELLAEAR